MKLHYLVVKLDINQSQIDMSNKIQKFQGQNVESVRNSKTILANFLKVSN
jgi:hypothetical protein